MFSSIQIINPTLEKNINLIVKLMRSVHGEEPGCLFPYTVYTLTDSQEEQEQFVLTLSVLQFVADPLADEATPKLRLDITEPYFEASGDFGSILPVIKSIIFNNEVALFDTLGSYIVKRISADHTAETDKPGKPNYYVRAATREQYLASQLPHLGADYRLIKREKSSYLHMNRVPGLPLDSYMNRLNAEQFLTLACTLLEEVPKQMHRIVRSGKHAGKMLVHCDLKPSNIMADYKDNQWRINVIDIGLAKTLTDGQYITLKSRGNIMVFDKAMLEAKQAHQTITYTTQTDFFALYVILFNLAGATHRRYIDNEKDLQKDLLNPNFYGLFSTMNFDLQTRIELTRLFEQMLSANKNEQFTIEQALSGFRNALKTYQATAVIASSKAVNPKTNPRVTAEALKICVEQKLGTTIKKSIKSGQSEAMPIKQWITKYRELCSLANERELSRFKIMLTDPSQIKIRNPCIYNFIRFALLDEYDDNACARLLIRHQQVIRPIEKALWKLRHSLPKEWSILFTRLLKEIPLQLTSAQFECCAEVGKFLHNASSLLNCNTHTHFSALLRDSVTPLITTNNDELINILPEFARTFNKKYYCMIQLTEVINSFEDLTQWKSKFIECIPLWTSAFSEKVISGEFPSNLERYFALRVTLANQLKRIAQSTFYINSLYDRFPTLIESPYNWEEINQLIFRIDLSDEQGVENLVQKIDTVFMFINLLAKCSDPTNPLRKNKAPMTDFLLRFEQLMDQHLMNSDVMEEAELLFHYFCAIEKMQNFIDRVSEVTVYPSLIKALSLLMLEPSLINNLNNLLLKRIHSNNFDRLNLGLRVLLSQEPREERNQMLFAEIARFYESPDQYKPYTSPITASSTPFGVFASKSTDEKALVDDELQLKWNNS